MRTAAVCSHCTTPFQIEVGALNRAARRGANIYCGRECSGLGRRKWKSASQKKVEKAEYDREYRQRDPVGRRASKAAYHRRTYDPVIAAEARKLRMPRHVEYCRQPAYRAKKKTYDREYRAKKDYGPLWECQVLTLQIREAALSQMSDYDIRMSKGTLNKSLRRKRDYEKSLRCHPEVGPLGNLERGERR